MTTTELQAQNAELTHDLRQVKNNLIQFLETLGIAKNGKVSDKLEISSVLGSIIDIGGEAMKANSPFASSKRKKDFAAKFNCIADLMPLLTKYEKL